jgi:predicted nuclease of predicted toxin-antitoxin system
VKFLVDMPLSPAVARWLVQQEHDAVHASAADLERAPDRAILARAAVDERIVVTVENF